MGNELDLDGSDKLCQADKLRILIVLTKLNGKQVVFLSEWKNSYVSLARERSSTGYRTDG